MPRALLVLAAIGLLGAGHAAAEAAPPFPDGCGVLTQLQAGDTCDAIAEGLGVTVADLRALNPGVSCSTISAGDYLCTSGLLANCGNVATVDAGATCEATAAAHSMSLNQLLGMNPQLKEEDCNSLPAGNACVAAPASNEECSGQVYTAAARDTCDSLAARFGLSCAQLRALNPDGFDAAGSAVSDAKLCIGCPPQPTCGVDVSPMMSAVLNANLNLCGVFASCKGQAAIDGQTLVVTVQPDDSKAASQLRITPNAFAGGDAMVQFTNLVPEVMTLAVQIDLASGEGVSVRAAGLEINVGNNRPLISFGNFNLLGLFGRRRLLGQARRLLYQRWRPRYYGFYGWMRTPMVRYY